MKCLITPLHMDKTFSIFTNKPFSSLIKATKTQLCLDLRKFLFKKSHTIKSITVI